MKFAKYRNGVIKFVILLIHVDDILLFLQRYICAQWRKEFNRFEIQDWWYEKSWKGISKRFDMEQCKPVSTPLEPEKHFQELLDDENPTNINE